MAHLLRRLPCDPEVDSRSNSLQGVDSRIPKLCSISKNKYTNGLDGACHVPTVYHDAQDDARKDETNLDSTIVSKLRNNVTPENMFCQASTC
ncbi:hypothetical protein E5D57_003532 [Metarhizium anisopliae]|nr:hypothetical protein E5D57_003532 [Metarhizium anisopliae]